MKLQLIPAGTFYPRYMFPENPKRRLDFDGNTFCYEQLVPRNVHFGYVDAGSDHWHSIGDIDVEYGPSGENRAVVVDVPADQLGRRFAYVLRFANDWTEIWTTPQCVNLAQPEGTFACLPIMNYARRRSGYVFGRDFSVSVWEGDGPEPVTFHGRILTIYYGFTDVTRTDFRSDENPPWLTSFGEFSHEGQIDIRHIGAGGQFGASVMPLVWVRVPRLLNVVFRVRIEKYTDRDWLQNRIEGNAETRAYLVDVGANGT